MPVDIVNKRKGSSKTNDILSQFMKHSDDIYYLRNVVTNFIIAGHDTTNSALTWCIYELGRHPEIYKKLRSEVVATNVTLKDLQSMKYLHGYISEILRLYPPIPADTKICREKTILPSGVMINRGERIIYLPLLTCRLETVWKDPDKIIPERWFLERKSQYEFPVFNGGYRICLGKQMAYTEISIFLWYILHNFSIELESEHIEQKVNITLNIKDGLYVKLNKL